jgi:hypothetical protein
MTKEEVIISMGLDNSSLVSGSKAGRFILEESIHDTMKSLKKLVAINVAEMGMKAVELWIDYSKKIAEEVNGIAEKIAEGKALDVLRAKLKAAVKDMQEITKAFSAANFENTLKGQTPEQQYETLRNAQTEAQDRAEAAANDMRAMRENEARMQREGWKRTAEESAQAAMQYATLDKKRMEALIDSWNYQQKMNEATDKIEAEREKNLRTAVSLVNEKEAAEARTAENVKAQNRVQRSINAEKTFTLADMAKADVLRGTRWGGMANEAMRNEEWARNNRLLGFQDLAAQQQRRADQIYEQIKKENPFLRDPQREMANDLKNQLEELRSINKNGVPIRQPNH